jgi:hypothetical protein
MTMPKANMKKAMSKPMTGKPKVPPSPKPANPLKLSNASMPKKGGKRGC